MSLTQKQIPRPRRMRGAHRIQLWPAACASLLSLCLCGCRTPSKLDAVAGFQSKFIVLPNITYLSVDGIDLRLDVYVPARQLGRDPWVKFSDERKPVLLYIHGGGWVDLNRSIRNLNFLPYIEKGWAVVNVDYRLLNQAPFPACIAD
jgi:acetyl esterase/lipase